MGTCHAHVVLLCLGDKIIKTNTRWSIQRLSRLVTNYLPWLLFHASTEVPSRLSLILSDYQIIRLSLILSEQQRRIKIAVHRLWLLTTIACGCWQPVGSWKIGSKVFQLWLLCLIGKISTFSQKKVYICFAMKVRVLYSWWRYCRIIFCVLGGTGVINWDLVRLNGRRRILSADNIVWSLISQPRYFCLIAQACLTNQGTEELSSLQGDLPTNQPTNIEKSYRHCRVIYTSPRLEGGDSFILAIICFLWAPCQACGFCPFQLLRMHIH